MAHNQLSGTRMNMAKISFCKMKSRLGYRVHRYAAVGLTVGIVVGFIVCFMTKDALLPCVSMTDCCLKQKFRAEIIYEMSEQAKLTAAVKPKKNKQVLIGVMTAAQFIDTRVLAVWRTWAKSINGDIVFFSSQGTPLRDGLPIVALPGVDDSYPPQKKSFMMLKYFHDFGIDKYDFFMRVDDDVYVHGRRLSKFLGSVNSSIVHYIGQAGTGTEEELGTLSLGTADNFCMGGPGIIFSQETLRRMIPHLGYCLQNLLTPHEDVELGRCVRMFAGAKCTFNFEMQKLFHHSYSYRTDRNVFPYVLTGPEMDRAITLHPIKSTDLMYTVHNEMVTREKAKLELIIMQKQQDVSSLPGSVLDSTDVPNSLHNYRPKACSEIVSGQFFNKKSRYIQSTFSVLRNTEEAWKKLLNKAIERIVHQLNSNALEKGRLLEFHEIVFGHHFEDPLKGINLILELMLEYKRIRGKQISMDIKKRVQLRVGYSSVVIREIPAISVQPPLYLLLPLSGRSDAFMRFLNNFDTVCSNQNANCRLLLIVLDGPEFESTQKMVLSSRIKEKITTLKQTGTFSRAMFLHEGALTLPADSLMIFIDVDMHFTTEALSRVRLHTKQGQQAYFPVVFSQYNSNLVCNRSLCPVDNLVDYAGSFRFFGFGIASIYQSDYFRVGAFDLTIHGWGKEDVDLFIKVVQHSITVFRAADSGFVHIYHPVNCDPSLKAEQLSMCKGTKASSYASKQTLSSIYLNKLSKPYS